MSSKESDGKTNSTTIEVDHTYRKNLEIGRHASFGATLKEDFKKIKGTLLHTHTQTHTHTHTPTFSHTQVTGSHENDFIFFKVIRYLCMVCKIGACRGGKKKFQSRHKMKSIF